MEKNIWISNWKVKISIHLKYFLKVKIIIILEQKKYYFYFFDKQEIYAQGFNRIKAHFKIESNSCFGIRFSIILIFRNFLTYFTFSSRLLIGIYSWDDLLNLVVFFLLVFVKIWLFSTLKFKTRYMR